MAGIDHNDFLLFRRLELLVLQLDDPGELVNRWSDPALAAVRQELMGRVIDFGERLERRAIRYCYA